ncbi:MAG: nucleotide exchange factor GrpE [Pseudomonadota bacterium]
MADDKPSETPADEAAAQKTPDAVTSAAPDQHDGSGGGEAAESETPDDTVLDPVDAEILSLTTERDELRDRLLRALADAENTRKRAERDRKDAEAFGGAKLARDLLSVHDNLARALDTVEETHREAMPAFIEGVELTLRELLSAFAKHKIEEVKPELGDKFDPNMHQAMFEAPVPGAEPGSVIQVINEGFSISGRLLRAAQVGVAAKSSSAAPAEPAEEGSSG